MVVVRKSNNEVRICADYKVTINQVLLVDEHPLPTIDELFSKMAGGKKFSKIDLSKAYLQLEVHPNDRHLLTLSTHRGLYQPTRLMVGVASAPAKFQRLMEQLLGGIQGVSVFLDDIKITAPDDETHIFRIHQVLSQLQKYNMRINYKKSEFMKDSITYCGYEISSKGIQKMQSKMDAIQNMKKPADKADVRSFMGLVNYYGRFVRNLSTVVYPLNRLLQDDVPFSFDESCEKAFKDIKQLMQSDTVLTHYDPKRPLILAVDASPIGVGAVLSHTYEDGSERPIQFASQTLSKVQQRYSHNDKEAYAVIYGVRKFHQYIYGRTFTLVTDNRAISQIFAPTKGLSTPSSTRMQHYAVFLEQYEYSIKCKKSKDNLNADAMSRLPTSDTYNSTEEVYVIEEDILQNLPVTCNELKAETKSDTEVKILMECLKYGRDCRAEDRFNISQGDFSLHDGCLLRGMRVYVPRKLRNSVLKELHTAHFGMSRMKSLARSYVWWSTLDKDIEKLVSNCVSCQSTRPDPKKILPIRGWNIPTRPFQRVHADYAGPIFGKYLFVLVDAYTKWPEVHIVSNMTTETTIQKCRVIFACFGLPNIFVSDHGRQFDSGEFKSFLKSNGIIHKQGAPYHPATNGQAERYVQTVKQKLLATKCTTTNMNAELSKILLAYRRCIHPVTGKSPAMAMMSRQINSRLDLLLPQNNNISEERTEICKSFAVGERVAVREYLHKIKWRFGEVLERIGELHYNIKLDDGRVWKRHIDQMRGVGENVKEMSETEMQKKTVEHDKSEFEEQEQNLTYPTPVPVLQDLPEIIQTSNQPCESISEPIQQDGLRRSNRIQEMSRRYIEID